ncbi:aldo/keto reductase [Homoserinimonas sedimenticola]|uniref:aldo/keto reductase n=1 Tax=Homoserinimonas sedimenticola TaxID=2986805 RepID=UPI0027E317A6|nr:aldo/keto reductase [Salinibacterium sedimenticola]
MSNPFSDTFPLALGGNTFGWTSDEETSHAVMDAFVASGGNHIDTADGYSAWVPGHSGGESEQIIGSWLARRGNRDSVTVATKVSTHPEYKGLSPANITAAAEASLERLGTDHIDLYYAHYDESERPMEEIAAAFDALVTSGKVLAIGVSNLSAARITEWMETAEKNNLAAPIALQPHYNLLTREPFESELAPLAAQHGLGVFTYFSLAAGMLTGKYRKPADFDGVDRSHTLGGYSSEQAFRIVDELADVAAEVDVAPASVALAWVRSKPTVVAPIASARTVEQLDALVAGARLELTAEQVARLDEVSA